MSMMLTSMARRVASSSVRRLATDAAPAVAMTLNFSTPHLAIYKQKVVDRVMIPGESGEYGVTQGHSPLISQLKPGVVSVIHTGGEVEKFFVAGGFALTHANSTTDLSVTEAVPLGELDEAAVKSGYADSVKAMSSSPEGSQEKAAAEISMNVYVAMARALNVAV